MKTQAMTKTSLIIIMLITLLSCNGYTKGDKLPTITKVFDMDQPGALITISSGGGIHVESHDQKKVEVQVYIRKNGKVLLPDSPQIDEILEGYDLEVEKNGSTITATAKRKSSGKIWSNTGIYFSVFVPREMSCTVSSHGGGVKVLGVTGTHELTSAGGSVKLENLSGSTVAKSSGGSVKAQNLSGEIHLTSSGGSVSLEKARGSIFARSSGGSVHLSKIHGDANAESKGGGVRIEGEAGLVIAKSNGGSVHVDIDGLDQEMHLESRGGGVKALIRRGEILGLDLDLKSTKVNIELENFSGQVEKNLVKGSMNDGGIPVYMRTSGGNITVLFEE